MRSRMALGRQRLGPVLLLAALAAAATLVVGPGPAAQTNALPFTFFLTHYELLGDPAHPSGVRYSSTGTPFAKARDGSSITFTGQGAWDPATRRATGTGTYVIKNRREEGWQGPPGSASFSGFLKLRVTLTGHGSGVLRLWCLMPTVPKPDGHVSDGLSFRGRGLRFTDFRQQEKRLEGVMFYSR